MDEESIFHLALEKVGSERAAFLAENCAGDDECRRRLEALIEAHDNTHGFLLDSPPAGLKVAVGPPVPERPGAVLGPYKLLQQIGEGGMGVVFMAEQKAPLERTVALKIIKPGMDTRQVIARFEAERQALAVMDHPHIAKVLDAGTTSTGRPYFVMELVKGVPITRYCDDKHLPLQERLELFIKVCLAVQHAHQKGIIHRDIKPTNVLVAEYDDQAVPKVIDFGVAKATAQRLTEQTMFTEFGQVLGTMEYMSPEQAKLNQLDIDTRSDIYSLGVLLYELLAGSTPFEGTRLKEAAFDEMLRIIREEEPPKPSARLSNTDQLASVAASRGSEPRKLSGLIAGELDWVAMKALEKDRNRRFETASAFAADIQRYLDDEPVQACPPSATYRIRKFARRNKPALIVSAAAVAALLLMIMGLAVSNRLISAERNETVIALKQKEQALSEKVQALALAQAQRERSDANFLKALVAIRDVITGTALGKENIPPSLRRKFSDRATKFYESLLQEDSADASLQFDSAVGYRTIGMLHNSWDEFSQAEKSYRRAIDILERLTMADPPAQRYQHQLGYAHLEFSRMLYRAKRFQEAQPIVDRGIDLYEKLVADTPDSTDYIAQLANFYIDPTKFGVPAEWQPGDDPHRAAFELLKTAANLPDKPPPPWLVHSADTIAHRQRDLAFALRGAGRLDEAREMLQYAARLFETLRNKDPDNTLYWHFLADTHRQIGLVQLLRQNLAQAEQEFRRAVAIHEQREARLPDESFNATEESYAYFDLARLLIKSGRTEEAMPLLTRGVEVDPTTDMLPVEVRAQIRLGDLLREAGDDDQALATYSDVIGASPNVSDAWVSRGWLYDKRQEWEKSESDFTKAIELQPDCGEAWSGRAFSHFHRQQWKPAIADYSQAISLNPDVHMNPFHRGRVYIELAQWEKAAADFSRAIEIDPNDSWSHYHRAQVYAQTNRPHDAIADLRQSIAKGFNDAQQMKTDKHLEPIRRSDDYQKLLTELEMNVTKS